MITVIIFTLCLFIIDFISKIIISNNFLLNKSVEIIPNFLNITYVKNYGAAWNILENNRYLLIIITLLFIGYVIRFLYKKNKYSKLEIISYSLLLGGTLGNLYDRIVRGYVIDFLDFNIFNYDYPVFNLADSFIVIGIILLFIKSSKKTNS